MKCRIGESAPFDFVHIIIEKILPILRSVAVQLKYVMVMPKWCLPQ